MSPRLALIAAVSAASLAVAAACAPPPANQPVVHTGPARYVALGDSWAAGPLIGTAVGEPAACGRSANNYPHLVATALDVREFVDVTCNAAQSLNLTASQPVLFGTAPPQFDALNSATSLVTMQIGGNDTGITNKVVECITFSASASPCSANLPSPDPLTVQAGYEYIRIVQAVDRIHELSPDAKVFVVGYPAVVPDTGDGCFPAVPVLARDVHYLREQYKLLNANIAAAAAATGAHFIDLYGPSLGHDLCQPAGLAWINGLQPTAPGLALHPNVYGHAGFAMLVTSAIRSATP